METENVVFKAPLKRKNSDKFNDSRLLKKAELEENDDQSNTESESEL